MYSLLPPRYQKWDVLAASKSITTIITGTWYHVRMITPSHAVYGLAFFGKANDMKRNIAVTLGGIAPDSITFLFFIVNHFLMGYSSEMMWDDMFFNSTWRPFINLSHSLILLPFLAFVGYYYGKRLMMFFFMSATVHAMFDFCVHTQDAYAHFWPLSHWRFISPLSYYDPQSYGNVVGLFDSIIVLALITYVWHHSHNKYWRGMFACLALLYTLSIGTRLFWNHVL